MHLSRERVGEDRNPTDDIEISQNSANFNNKTAKDLYVVIITICSNIGEAPKMTRDNPEPRMFLSSMLFSFIFSKNSKILVLQHEV